MAISHRGRYNDFIVDNAGRHHPVGNGVTTFYVLDHNGQDVHKFDPLSPRWAKTTIGLPETSTTSFVANSISVSASTIMAIGFEYDWISKNYQPKIITRMADVDTEGGNPALRYGYKASGNNQNHRILPVDRDWLSHPLVLTSKAMVTKNITISQTGEGNLERELVIEGRDADGNYGYYRKKLSDSAFTFIKVEEPAMPLLPISPITPSVDQSRARNYRGSINEFRADLLDFNQHANHAKLIVDIDGVSRELHLYRRFGVANFIFGVERFKYDLVIDDPVVEKALGGHKVIRVKVAEKPGKLIIESRMPSRPLRCEFFA